MTQCAAVSEAKIGKDEIRSNEMMMADEWASEGREISNTWSMEERTQMIISFVKLIKQAWRMMKKLKRTMTKLMMRRWRKLREGHVAVVVLSVSSSTVSKSALSNCHGCSQQQLEEEFLLTQKLIQEEKEEEQEEEEKEDSWKQQQEEEEKRTKAEEKEQEKMEEKREEKEEKKKKGEEGEQEHKCMRPCQSSRRQQKHCFH